MKLVVYFLIGLVIGCWLLAFGCVSPQRQSALAELQSAYQEAVADGVVEAKEAADLSEKAKAVANAPEGFDWATVGAAAGTALLAMFPMLRYVPNRYLIGQAEADAVDKAAGIR